MKTVSLSGSIRSNVGKKDAKALRMQGLVPCVVYGGEKQIHFHASEKAFGELFYTPEVCFVELNLDGQKIMAIPQDVQYHKVTDQILHVDFWELNEQKVITMAVPVLTTGSSVGVLKGGKLQKSLRKVRVSALPKDMPENITIDITDMEIHDFKRISDVPASNFTIKEAPSTKLVAVQSTRAAAAAAVADAKADGKK